MITGPMGLRNQGSIQHIAAGSSDLHTDHTDGEETHVGENSRQHTDGFDACQSNVNGNGTPWYLNNVHINMPKPTANLATPTIITVPIKSR